MMADLLRLRLTLWQTAALLALLAAAVIAVLAWLCARSPEITFLVRDGRAEWIRFPSAADARTHRIVNLDVIFRSTFNLENPPRMARLSIRADRRVALKINDKPVETGTSTNWKDVSIVDVLDFVRAGANSIEARVYNEAGPPLLWLLLDTDQLALQSDGNWEASFAGSAWRHAWLAAKPKLPGAGNPIGGGERVRSSLAAIWPIWIFLGVIAAIVWLAGDFWFRRLQISSAFNGGLRLEHAWLLLIFASLWLILFWNNAVRFPFNSGFDAKFHLDYIKYVQERWALPSPGEGFETHQPPLFYIVTAAVLSACRLSISDGSAVVVLRCLTGVFGLAQVVFVFLSLRLLFPGRVGSQLIGLMLAAFLPMQLYMPHYVTNEVMAAAFVSAALYLGLRILRNENGSWMQYTCLGLCLGAALLTKATGVVLLPPLFLALLINLIMKRWLLWISLRNLAAMLAACFAVCGWYYLRSGFHSKTPFLGIAGNLAWWGEPGYRTIADYTQFGRSLSNPLFSSFAGFADGIYSTLWGDGLCGGVPDLALRPPWNYDLMVAGYLLAAVPTLLILAGVTATVYRFIRKPSAEALVLLGFSAAVCLGLVFMTLRVPAYVQIKAFFAICALMPICFFGASGWDLLTQRRRSLQFTLGTILLLWAMNSFASFWVRPSVSQHVNAALRWRIEGDAARAKTEAAKAVSSDPSNATAQFAMAFILDDAGRSTEALEYAARAVELAPQDPVCRLQLGLILAKRSQIDLALNAAGLAVEMGPELLPAYHFLSTCLLQSERQDEAIAILHDGLAVSPFNAELHHTLAGLMAEKQDWVQSANQFAYALLLRPKSKETRTRLRQVLATLADSPDGPNLLAQVTLEAPDSPDMFSELGWLRATHPDPTRRNGDEALRLAKRACDSSKKPATLATLAAAYAEMGRFDEAIRTAQEALALARSSGEKAVAALSENLLATFQTNTPYRASPMHR